MQQQGPSTTGATAAAEAHVAAAADEPRHLVVLVNGLWGWQRDWKMTKRYFDECNKSNKLLIHISRVNTGPLTYEGIDVCGTRLAEEVIFLTLSNPSLTHISVVGHSMGGLITRYALGLLLNPVSNLVAGLRPMSFVTIASPHIGCSSHHPEEVEWQDRPWMRWLTAAVRSGYLGHSPDLQHAAAAAVGGNAAAAAVAEESKQQQQQEAMHAATSGSSSSGRMWPWTPCRSVIHLLGCDSWHGPAAAAAASDQAAAENAMQDSSINSNRHTACCNCTISQQQQQQQRRNACVGNSSAHCAQCTSQQQQQQQQCNKDSCTVHFSSKGCIVCGASGCFTVTETAGGSSSGSSSSSSVRPLLDHLCRDVQIKCNKCSACYNCYFLSSLKVFKFRSTYSSAGGDHLIPWSSSSLLFPHQLPRKRESAAAAAAAAATGSGLLPAAALWGKPHIVEWSPDTSLRNQDSQQQQQRQPQKDQDLILQQEMHESASAKCKQQHDVKSFQLQQEMQDPASAKCKQQQDDKSFQLQQEMQDPAAAAAAGGVLSDRLTRLQSTGSWRHYHVVWPRLCLGSSHCNIQYNGWINFVGQSVVEHVVRSVITAADDTAAAAAAEEQAL